MKNYVLSFTFILFGLITFSQNQSWSWVKGSKGTDTKYDHANSVCTDKNGNVYIAGSFGSSVFTIGTATLTNLNPGNSMFIAKYTSSGNFLWAKSSGGSNEMINDICTDSQGNIYITGYYITNNLSVFGIQANVIHGYADMFVAKLDPSGNGLWVKNAGGALYSNGKGLCLDASGNIFVTGYYKYDIYFDSTYITDGNPYCTGEIFVAKYSNNGSVIWAKSAGSNSADEGHDICIDKDGNLIVAGHSTGNSLTFGNITLTNPGGKNAVLAKYSPSGNIIWVINSGYGLQSTWNSVCTDSKGDIYVGGADYVLPQSVTDLCIFKYSTNGAFKWKQTGGGQGNDYGTGICVDSKDNVYITGQSYSDTTSFGSMKFTTPGGCAFLVKYDTSGSLKNSWVNGAMHDGGLAVCADAQDNVYESGSHWKNISFGSTVLTNTNTNSSFVYIAKLAVSSTTNLTNGTAEIDHEKTVELDIFPNPTNGILNLRINLPASSTVSLSLYDQVGKQFWSPKIIETTQEGQNEFQIQTFNIPPGLYFMVINGPSWIISRKITMIQ